MNKSSADALWNQRFWVIINSLKSLRAGDIVFDEIPRIIGAENMRRYFRNERLILKKSLYDLICKDSRLRVRVQGNGHRQTIFLWNPCKLGRRLEDPTAITSDLVVEDAIADSVSAKIEKGLKDAGCVDTSKVTISGGMFSAEGMKTGRFSTMSAEPKSGSIPGGNKTIDQLRAKKATRLRKAHFAKRPKQLTKLDIPQSAAEADGFRRYLIMHPEDTLAAEGLKVWDAEHPKDRDCDDETTVPAWFEKLSPEKQTKVFNRLKEEIFGGAPVEKAVPDWRLAEDLIHLTPAQDERRCRLLRAMALVDGFFAQYDVTSLSYHLLREIKDTLKAELATT